MSYFVRGVMYFLVFEEDNIKRINDRINELSF